MTVLRYTSYVDRSVDDVRARLREAEVGPAEIEVEPFVDRTRIVIRHPWSADDEATRRTSSLTATRLALHLNELAAA